jgi:hypothetical protein
MNALKKLDELDTVDRAAPCQEYPGEWLVFIPESLGSHWSRFWFSKERTHLGHSFQAFNEAMEIAKGFLAYLENEKVEYNPTKITIGWKASDNDPRSGEVWFASCFVHGKFNVFGEYKQT